MDRDDPLHPIRLFIISLQVALSFLAEHLIDNRKPELDPKEALIAILKSMQEKEREKAND